MILQLTVPNADPNTDPNSAGMIQQAENAAAQQASAWTVPVYIGSQLQANGLTNFYYQTDAVPKTPPSVVSTKNIAPTLLPPHVA